MIWTKNRQISTKNTQNEAQPGACFWFFGFWRHVQAQTVQNAQNFLEVTKLSLKILNVHTGWENNLSYNISLGWARDFSDSYGGLGFESRLRVRIQGDPFGHEAVDVELVPRPRRPLRRVKFFGQSFHGHQVGRQLGRIPARGRRFRQLLRFSGFLDRM